MAKNNFAGALSAVRVRCCSLSQVGNQNQRVDQGSKSSQSDQKAKRY